MHGAIYCSTSLCVPFSHFAEGSSLDFLMIGNGLASPLRLDSFCGQREARTRVYRAQGFAGSRREVHGAIYYWTRLCLLFPFADGGSPDFLTIEAGCLIRLDLFRSAWSVERGRACIVCKVLRDHDARCTVRFIFRRGRPSFYVARMVAVLTSS